MQRKIRLMIGILIMTGLIAGCWKVSKNLQKELKEEMETIGEAEKSDRIVVLDAGHGGTDSCLLYTSPSPRDGLLSRMPSSA